MSEEAGRPDQRRAGDLIAQLVARALLEQEPATRSRLTAAWLAGSWSIRDNGERSYTVLIAGVELADFRTAIAYIPPGPGGEGDRAA